MQIDRRFILKGLGGCACCAGLPVPATAQDTLGKVVQGKVAGLAEIKGCFVDSNNANLVLGANAALGRAATMPPEVTTMVRSSGNPDLDKSFDRALQRLAETFEVWPKVGFYDDGDAPNAMAMRYAVGTTHEFAVVFGRNYFTKMMQYDPSGITLLQTAAHEFAHVWVYQEGIFETILGGQQTVTRVELHADFLAGYYLGVRKRDNPQAKFWAAGMRRWQSEFHNVQHHGQPDERLAAAEAGFRLGFLDGKTAKEAFAAATAYVAKM